MEDEYGPTYENTLPGITNIATPIAKSTPVTQTMPEKDITEPLSRKRARTTYLEQQMQDMSSVRLPLNIPLMEEESHASTDLTRIIHVFCKMKRKKETGMGIT